MDVREFIAAKDRRQQEWRAGLAAYLARLKTELGLKSDAEFATHLGIPAATMSKMLTCERAASDGHLAAVMVAAGLSIEQLAAEIAAGGGA